MKSHTAFLLFTIGFLMTFGGVGSVELSEDTAALVTGVLVSGLGLLVMYAGTLGLRNAHYYD
jgi:hypothetical protein